MLQNNRNIKLAHEVLTTFLVEVMADIYNRSIVQISTDSESPEVHTLNVLLTQKTGSVFGSQMDFDVCNISLESHPNSLQQILGPKSTSSLYNNVENGKRRNQMSRKETLSYWRMRINTCHSFTSHVCYLRRSYDEKSWACYIQSNNREKVQPIIRRVPLFCNFD